MKRKIKFHIHSHTKASDGNNTILEMAEKAVSAGVDLLILTDHNTVTENEVIEDAEKKTGLIIIQGIEYTTFYGHIVSFGSRIFPFEKITQEGLNLLASSVRKDGGVIGIAHPMGIGDPVCTGCSYNFKNTDYNLIDYIEVYHGNENEYGEWEKNRRFYMDRLKEGFKLHHVFAGDYHSSEDFKEAPFINICEVAGETPGEVKKEVTENIRNGKVLVSNGTYPEISIMYNEREYQQGDTLKRKKDHGEMYLMLRNLSGEGNSIIVSSEKGRILKYIIGKGIPEELCLPLDLKGDEKSIFAEISDEDNLIAFSNPIFIR